MLWLDAARHTRYRVTVELGSQHAADDHKRLFGREEVIALFPTLTLREYQRFMFGCNQLFIFLKIRQK